MLTDAFLPSSFGTVTISVTTSSATTDIPANGDYIELQNADANNTVFIETCQRGLPVAALVAKSYPVRPGQCKVIRRKLGDDAISCIGSGAATFYVTAGVGV